MTGNRRDLYGHAGFAAFPGKTDADPLRGQLRISTASVAAEAAPPSPQEEGFVRSHWFEKRKAVQPAYFISIQIPLS